MRREHDVLVGFVGDDKSVVLLREGEDLLQFGSGEHFASRVRRVANNDRLWFLVKSERQRSGIKAVVWRPEAYVDRLSASENGIGGVVLIKGRKDDNLI